MMASAATSSVVVLSSFFRKQLPPPPTTLSSVTARRSIGGGRGMIVVAKTSTRRENRIARHVRIRKKVEGTTERPRLCVFRSNKNIFVQVIDDSKMHTLASAGTMMKSMAGEFDYTSGPTIEAAKKVGAAIAKACLDKGIDKVVFDRGGYPYHGRVKALAEAARENGLSF